MPDYAAAPIQPIVEGLVTFPGGAPAISFDGKGVSAIARIAGHPLGAYVLTLDEGLPGNAGAVPFGPSPPLAPDPDVRTLILPIGVGVPPVSGVHAIGVAYNPSGISGVGAFQIFIVLTNMVFALVEPVNGFQIIVWRGLGGGVVP